MLPPHEKSSALFLHSMNFFAIATRVSFAVEEPKSSIWLRFIRYVATTSSHEALAILVRNSVTRAMRLSSFSCCRRGCGALRFDPDTPEVASRTHAALNARETVRKLMGVSPKSTTRRFWRRLSPGSPIRHGGDYFVRGASKCPRSAPAQLRAPSPRRGRRCRPGVVAELVVVVVAPAHHPTAGQESAGVLDGRGRRRRRPTTSRPRRQGRWCCQGHRCRACRGCSRPSTGSSAVGDNAGLSLAGGDRGHARRQADHVDRDAAIHRGVVAELALAFWPQHLTPPLEVSAQVWAAPATTTLMPEDRPVTAVGIALLVRFRRRAGHDRCFPAHDPAGGLQDRAPVVPAGSDRGDTWTRGRRGRQGQR